MIGSCGCFSLASDHRQFYDEGGSLSWRALGIYLAIMAVNNPLTDAQAKPRSFARLSGGKEGVKYPLQILLRYPRAIIHKRYLNGAI